MRNPNGYAVITDPSGKSIEMDTVMCAHCNKHTHIKPKQSPSDIGGFCFACTKAICAQCVGKPCDVIEKKLERAEASYHARRSYGI